jgi:hypothetical protein
MIAIPRAMTAVEAKDYVLGTAEFATLAQDGYVYQRMIAANDTSNPATVANIAAVVSASAGNRPIAPNGVPGSVTGKIVVVVVDMRGNNNSAYITYADRGL